MTMREHPHLSTLKLFAVTMGLLTILTMIALAGVFIQGERSTNDVKELAKRQTAALAQANYEAAIRNWHEKLNSCARGKVDRTSIALALRAQATYLNGVLDAVSVKADVKRAARKAQARFNLSATDLESRTGFKLICPKVIVKPTAPPGVRELP